MTLDELVVLYGSNHSGKASHDIIKVLHFLRVTPFQHCQHKRNILKDSENSSFGKNNFWHNLKKHKATVMYEESSWAQRLSKTIHDGSSPTTEVQLPLKGSASSAISHQHPQNLARAMETDSCYVGEREVWYFACAIISAYAHTPLPVTSHFFLMKDADTSLGLSRSRPSVAAGMRDRSNCLEDKPTPLRAIRSWPLLPLSLSHTFPQSPWQQVSGTTVTIASLLSWECKEMMRAAGSRQINKDDFKPSHITHTQNESGRHANRLDFALFFDAAKEEIIG